VAGFRRVLTRKTWAHARQAGMGPLKMTGWKPIPLKKSDIY